MLNPQYRQQLQSQLGKLATQANFESIVTTAFGTKIDSGQIQKIRQQWLNNDFSIIPKIDVLSKGELGTANGGYAASEDRIFVSSDFLAQHPGDPQAVTELLLEEVGHKLDRVFNGNVDSPGDEGEIFRLLASGQTLSPQMLAGLKAQDDRAVITVGGKLVSIEQQDIFGDDRDNVIGGTNASDEIRGYGGNDILTGLGGDDVIYGDDGNDKLYGDDGNDKLYAGNGDDLLYGGNGNDQLVGENGNDYLYGGNGNDALFGNDGDDFLTGDDGNDRLDGDDGNDSLFSEAGNDTLFGGAGNDTFCFGDPLAGSIFLYDLLGKDRIADFTKGQDKIVLSKSTFTTITSAVNGSIGTNFATVANDTLADGSAATIVYSLGSGNLFYNENGTTVIGLGGVLSFATVTGTPVLAASDFSIVV